MGSSSAIISSEYITQVLLTFIITELSQAENFCLNTKIQEISESVSTLRCKVSILSTSSD